MSTVLAWVPCDNFYTKTGSCPAGDFLSKGSKIHPITLSTRMYGSVGQVSHIGPAWDVEIIRFSKNVFSLKKCTLRINSTPDLTWLKEQFSFDIFSIFEQFDVFVEFHSCREKYWGFLANSQDIQLVNKQSLWEYSNRNYV